MNANLALVGFLVGLLLAVQTGHVTIAAKACDGQVWQAGQAGAYRRFTVDLPCQRPLGEAAPEFVFP